MKRFNPWGIQLPYPPSINHAYFTSTNGKRFLKPKAAAFKEYVTLLVASGRQRFGGVPFPFTIVVSVWTPDKRKRDLDNLLKVLQDATCAGLRVDDSTVSTLMVLRRGVIDGGMVELLFMEDIASELLQSHVLTHQHRIVVPI